MARAAQGSPRRNPQRSAQRQGLPVWQPHWHAEAAGWAEVWQPQVQAAPMQLAHEQALSFFMINLRLGWAGAGPRSAFFANASARA